MPLIKKIIDTISINNMKPVVGNKNTIIAPTTHKPPVNNVNILDDLS
jgi:hypothetical protein